MSELVTSPILPLEEALQEESQGESFIMFTYTLISSKQSVLCLALLGVGLKMLARVFTVSPLHQVLALGRTATNKVLNVNSIGHNTASGIMEHIVSINPHVFYR